MLDLLEFLKLILKMGTVHIDIDEGLLLKIKKIAELRGFNTINEFILRTIENEISSQYIIQAPDDDEFEIDKRDSALIHQFTEFSSKLKKITAPDKKIELLLSVDDFIKAHESFLKEKYPELLVNILNSL